MRSRWLAVAVFAILTASATGCGGSAPQVTTELAQAMPGLNGGTAYPIPGDFGYAEIVVERTKPGQPVTLVVYFLDPTAKKALPVAPTAVRAKLVLPVDNEPIKDVTLTAKAKPGAGEGTRFASAPGPFDFDELRGELFLTLSGQDVVVPFAFR